MTEKNVKRLYAPNLISICINRKNGVDYEGEIWEEYDTEPAHFTSMLGAVRYIENFLDELNFPQRAMIPRSFTGTSAQRAQTGRHRERVKRMNNLEAKNGEEGTFIVQIKYRQNATWQGQVVWAEQNRKEYFRSALELLRLIDGAMSAGTEGFAGATQKTAEESGPAAPQGTSPEEGEKA